VPAILHFVFQLKLLAGAFDEPVVPLLRRQIWPRLVRSSTATPGAVSRRRAAIRTMSEDFPIWRAVST